MRLLILAAALAFPAASPAADFKPAKADCRLTHHAGPQGKAEAKKLTELPPGQLVLTVFRRDKNGCPVPLVVREGIGGQPGK